MRESSGNSGVVPWNILQKNKVGEETAKGCHKVSVCLNQTRHSVERDLWKTE
ncbi:MAG: hypothetical protein ACK5KL_08890 [Dysgonomonas sp.]